MASLLRSVPFWLIAAGHAYLMWYELYVYFTTDLSGFVTLPVILLAGAGLLDNVRLFLGAYFGPSGLSPIMTYVAYFLDLAGVPLLFLVMFQMLADASGWSYVALFGKVITTGLCMHGINAFLTTVIGRLVTVDDFGVHMLTLDPKKCDFNTMAAAFIVQIAGMVFGLILWLFFSYPTLFLLQLICFLGQGAVGLLPFGQYMTYFLMLPFLGSYIHAQTILYTLT